MVAVSHSTPVTPCAVQRVQICCSLTLSNPGPTHSRDQGFLPTIAGTQLPHTLDIYTSANPPHHPLSPQGVHSPVQVLE